MLVINKISRKMEDFMEGCFIVKTDTHTPTTAKLIGLFCDKTGVLIFMQGT